MLISHLHFTCVYTAAFSKPETRNKQKQKQPPDHHHQKTTLKQHTEKKASSEAPFIASELGLPKDDVLKALLKAKSFQAC